MTTVRKTCRACRRRLSAAAFNDSGRSPDGLAATCRACTNARRRDLARVRPARPSATDLGSALRTGDVRAVRARLRAGAEPHWSWVGETMREGHVAVAELLLAAGVESNIFTLAAMADVAGVRKRLRRAATDAELAADFEPGCRGVTPLHVACSSDWRAHAPGRTAAQVEVANLLHEAGARLTAVARYRGMPDSTPLFCACWTSGNVGLVRWLLDRGATVTDRDFTAALGHFQRHGRAADDLAAFLLTRGAPVDGRVRGERTPLQAAANQGTHKTVGWLIDHGADVIARGPGGRTAAHFAAERNTGPTTLARLVAAGADLTVRDTDGHTPLDLARLNGKTRLVEWIESQIARLGRSRGR